MNPPCDMLRCVILFMVLTTCGWAQAQHEFHVAPDGDDDSAGSVDAPFRTLERAQRAVREVNQGMTQDIHVYLHEGTYRLDETLTFKPGDSGFNGFAVVYRNVPGERAVVSGGSVVSNWRLHDAEKGIWVAPAPPGVGFRQLYVDGKRAIRARSSQGLPVGTEKRASGYSLPNDSMSTWRNVDQLEFVFREQWREPRCLVASIDGTSITMQQPGWAMCNSWGIYTSVFNVDYPIYIENAYELLDQPAEWYLDRAEDKVYLIPFGSAPPGEIEVIAPILERLIRFDGTAADPVHDIRVEGLVLCDATWDMGAPAYGYPSIQATVMGAAGQENVHGTLNEKHQVPGNITLAGAQNVKFIGNTFTRLGAVAVELVSACSDCQFIGNLFTETSGGAMQLGRYNEPYLPSEETIRNTLFENNYIHDVALDYRDHPAITCFFTDSTVIQHNEIERVPYSAISMGWGWGRLEEKNGQTIARNNQILNNHISNHMLLMEDGSAIYCLGWQPELLIEGNHIHDTGAVISPGIYLDRGCRYMTVRNNVIYNCESNMMVKGTDHLIEYNFWQDEFSTRRPGAPSHWVYWGVATLYWKIAHNVVVMDEASMPASIIQQAGIRPQDAHLLPVRGGLDSQPPTVPAALSSPRQTDVTIDLEWEASTDDVHVTGYEIRQDGRTIGATQDLRWKATGLEAERSYQFEVAARDRDGNLSPFSEPITVATQPTSENLALNRPVYGFTMRKAGNNWNPANHYTFIRQETNHSPAKAVDGDPESFVVPQPVSSPWMFQLDLERQYELDRVVVNFPAPRTCPAPFLPIDLEVLVSNNIDEELWESISTHEGVADASLTVDMKGVKARHIRVRSLANQSSATVMGIAEMEVYGSPGG